jgi:hypothetical protein
MNVSTPHKGIFNRLASLSKPIEYIPGNDPNQA